MADYETGGSIRPYEPKGDEVLARRSNDEGWPAVWPPRDQFAHLTYDEGGALAPGVTFTNTGAPEPVFTAEQIERGRAWLRDHYRDGTFRCPGGSETGGNPGGTEGGGG